MRPKELTGQRFGRLRVLETTARPAHRNGTDRWWKCQCACGEIVITTSRCLTSGNTQSCGCLQRDRTGDSVRTHGSSRTHLYWIYTSMLQRCSNSRSESYQWYGGRGIAVCDRWREDFRHFVADMGNPPSRHHSLDRIDNDGPYSPENCRWATAAEQRRNNRLVRLLTLGNATMCVKDWATHLKMPVQTLHGRLRQGWSIERALTTPHPWSRWKNQREADK